MICSSTAKSTQMCTELLYGSLRGTQFTAKGLDLAFVSVHSNETQHSCLFAHNSGVSWLLKVYLSP